MPEDGHTWHWSSPTSVKVILNGVEVVHNTTTLPDKGVVARQLPGLDKQEHERID